MRNLNIWLIKIGEPLPIENGVQKMRTAMLADKLVKRGHNVLWWSSAFDHFKRKWLFKRDNEISIEEGFRIIALKGIGYRKNISFSRFIDHRIIANKFRKLVSKVLKPDIIVSSTPPLDLAYKAAIFAGDHNIPILVDIRDLWPDIFLNHVPIKLQRIAKILLHRDFKMIKKTTQMATGLIAATNTFLEWGLKYSGRDQIWMDRFFYLGYTKGKILEDITASNKFIGLMEILKKKFIVSFVGNISRSYHNPSILLKVAEKLSDYNNIHFIIAGDGELFKELKTMAQSYNNITLTGWLNKNEIEFLLYHSNVGVCPLTKAIDFPTNKAFAYLSAGLPLISAYQGDLKEIIEKHEIGFYCPPNDVDAFVGCIQKLYDTPALHKKISGNAIRVFNEMFDADKIYDAYAEHIEKVVAAYEEERS